MAPRTLLLALSAIAAASPLSAAGAYEARATAPPGTPDTRYCMRIEALTGSRLELVKCWTRQEWTDRGVDVDHDWAEDGVRTTG